MKWNDVIECKCSMHCKCGCCSNACVSSIHIFRLYDYLWVCSGNIQCTNNIYTHNNAQQCHCGHILYLNLSIHLILWYKDNNHSFHNFQCKKTIESSSNNNKQSPIQQLNNSASHKMANILRDHGSSLLKCTIKKQAHTHTRIYTLHTYNVTVWNAHSYSLLSAVNGWFKCVCMGILLLLLLLSWRSL